MLACVLVSTVVVLNFACGSVGSNADLRVVIFRCTTKKATPVVLEVCLSWGVRISLVHSLRNFFKLVTGIQHFICNQLNQHLFLLLILFIRDSGALFSHF